MVYLHRSSLVLGQNSDGIGCIRQVVSVGRVNGRIMVIVIWNLEILYWQL